MKFTNRFGKDCRYKFGDLVIYQDNEYIVHNAIWIGNSNGFWEIYLLNQCTQNIISIFRLSNLRKVGSIYE